MFPIYNIRGEAPLTAFLADALIISISTCIGTIAKDTYDPDGDKNAIGFFLYFVIVLSTAFLIHTVFMFLFAYGGGMLANPQKKISVTWHYFKYGKVDTSASDSFL